MNAFAPRLLFCLLLLAFNARGSSLYLAPAISGFSPTTISAGSGSLLTITGTEFGTTIGSVLFKNADNGGGTFFAAANSQIVSWATNQIVVKVPADAGTGQIAVVVNGTPIYSSGILTVKFSVLDGLTSSGLEPIRIVNDNGAGGYTFQMETSFNANTPAKDSFKRALDSWKCKTNINWVIGPTTAVNTVATDDINVIKFGGTGEIEAGTLGYTLSSWRKCNDGKWELRDADIVFNTKDYTWNYGSGAPTPGQFDFETVALHELGHAHSLGHVINPVDPMHYSIGSGYTNRVLSDIDIEGGNFVMAYSTPVIKGSCAGPIIPLPSGSCNAALPTINSFSPTSASTGVTVTIVGTNLTNALAVTFGNIAASSFTVVSPTVINAVVAGGATGSISVTTPSGITTLPGFTYLSKLPQTLTGSPLPIKTFGDDDFDPGVTSSAGLPVTYTSSNTLVATLVNNKVRIVGAGTSIITASQAGNATYNAAANVNLNLLVNKAHQSIIFPVINAKELTDPDFEPGATASSGLMVTYASSNPAVATIVANKIHIVGAGATTITATQAGNANIAVANPVSVQFMVNKANQTITFPPMLLKNPTDAGFDPNATASSGLPISYRSSNTTVATLIAGKVHIMASGTTVITATQTGNTNFNAAPEVAQTLEVVFTLPASNFTVKATDETCKTSDNGSINLTAAQALNYTASVMVSGVTTNYPFSSTLALNNLPAGSYTICVTVAGQSSYKQCFDVLIKEPKDLAVYSSLKENENLVVLQLEGGERYTIELNGVITTTTNQEISLPLLKGNNVVKISSDKMCQGSITRNFVTSNRISIYPNPVKSILNMVTGSNDQVKIEIHALDGRLMHTGKYIPEYRQVGVDVSKLNKGLYVLTLSVGNSKTVHKLIKD